MKQEHHVDVGKEIGSFWLCQSSPRIIHLFSMAMNPYSAGENLRSFLLFDE